MAQILVRDIPDEIVERLKARASEHGRSPNGEVLAILDSAASRPSRAEIRRRMAELRARGQTQESDAVTLLREDRDR